MSGRNTGAKKEDEKSGLGFLGALAVAGGAAVIGYLANDLYKSYQEFNNREQPLPSASRQKTEQQKEQARRQARNPSDDIPEAVRCVVCMNNQREIVTDPCGHVSLCLDCGDKVRLCPICQARIENKRLVYVS